MSAAVRELFCELVDTPGAERERILAERQIPADVCADVESLLNHDSAFGKSLTRRVSDAMEDTLRSSSGPPSYRCGAYRLVQLVGSGGMGTVYLAERRDGEIEQKVAIKLLRADSDRPAWRDRFLRERQLLAYLNHPSIARLLDVGHTGDGRPYLVMEYVDGVTIDEYAAPLDLRAQLKLFLLVCDGVSHAHGHLIVHRDLKPSNILVDSAGHPKLLDFGIAKLLDTATDQTGTVERLLTPNYASPEQRRGDVQTIATDVYSLGAVLYRLVTGRSSREPVLDASPAKQDMAGEGHTTAPSRLNPNLPRDIDHILLKALRYEPDERYASVDAFANDIRALLESRPVQARSGDSWYWTRKFLRRYRVAVAAATFAIASLLTGLQIANHQRGIAQKRFLQVRQLANKVVALDQAVGGLDGSTKARQEIAAMSKVYLEALGVSARTDHDLALEVGEAYSLLARVQGISVDASSAQQAEAKESLRKADTFVEASLRANPDNRKGLLSAARISHHRMTIAQANSRNEETVAYSRRSAGYLDQLAGLGALSEVESEIASQLFNDISLVYKNLHLYGDAIRYARRSIEVARFSPKPQLRLSHGLSMLANLLRLSGDLEGALQAIREARTNLGMARFPSERTRRLSWALVLSREGKILGAASGIGLDRPNEAIALFQKAFDLIEDSTQQDPEDNWSRMLFATLGRDFGDIVRRRDPRRALAVYDHALLRLREVKNNPEARRGEAEVLAGSSYALRQLNRFDESRERIDGALRLLGETNDYPTDRINPHDAVYEALRALGDHLAETDQLQEASEVYQNLLNKIMQSNPDPQNNLNHAVAFSQIFGSLAVSHRRSGQRDRGEAFAALRLQLWRHWDRNFPDNSLIRRQLASARAH